MTSRPLDLFDLTGRVAVVTGGSRGLGLEIASALGQAGASVVITGRRAGWLDEAKQSLEAGGVRCAATVADAADPDDVERLLRSTVDTFGRIDVVVNNAGITWGAPVLEMPLDRWRSVLDTNTTSAFLMSQTFGRYLIAQGEGGRIINVTSAYGLVGAPADILDAVGYSASKGAIVALTRDLAVKWAVHGVLVNAIAPSFFPTRLTADALETHGDAILGAVPAGRLPDLWEIRGAVIFLASRASSYVTGQILAIDGGVTAR